jgi:GNAT superfamily N-acetyltransferase
MKSARNSTGVQIRRAKPSDASRLAELTTQLGYPATANEIRERLARLLTRPEHAVFVAEAPGSGPIGWLHVSIALLLECPLRAEIGGLVVDEAQRSCGAGAQLLAAAEAWARAKACEHMFVRSNVIRERAHQFYERHGFQQIKTQKAFRKPL